MNGQRRSTMNVILDVLRTIQSSGNRAKPTHILYKANLSHKLLKKYLAMLLTNGFIEDFTDGNRIYYRLTTKGQEFIVAYKKMEKLAIGFGLPI